MARRTGDDNQAKRRAHPRSSVSVEMVVPPAELKVPVGPEYDGDVFIWDLDKTYLRTEFDHLSDLVRTALEKAKDKVAYAGAAPLLRALRRGPRGERPIYFVSASPPQLAEVIQEKFELDGVQVDGIYFKDNLRNVRPGRLDRLREQMGYKLLALIDLRARLPRAARETLFGDDTENDAAVYSFYSEILTRRLHGGALLAAMEKQEVFRDEAVRIAWRARKLGLLQRARRVYISMRRRLDPRYYRRYGPDVVATRTHLQTAASLYADARIGPDDLAAVADELLSRGEATRAELVTQLEELRRVGVLTRAQEEDQLRELRTRGLLAALKPGG